jgi:isoquinoline 1-oxidoreductase alpha subunit
MTQMVKAALSVNGVRHEITAYPDTTLLWILRDKLKLTGTKYRCGRGECGACTVHLDGKPALACQYVIDDIGVREITTIEGLSPESAFALYEAWAGEQLPPCDRCQSGQIMRAAGLLAQCAHPTPSQSAEYMRPNDCNCGASNRMAAVIERAAIALAE